MIPSADSLKIIIMGGCLELIKGLFRTTRHFNINGKRLK